MADIEYIKNYKEKELRQYILAYLLIAIASVGFQTVEELKVSENEVNLMLSIFQMIMTDIFVGAICVLVLILNEIWSDKMKTKLVYWKLPSDNIFTRISMGKVDSTGFELDKAKTIYAHLFTASSSNQTAEWNMLLRKCRDSEHNNVVEAERMQLMTRDICLSTISLLITNIIMIIIFSIINKSICISIKIFLIPIIYLIVMVIITKITSMNRANRFLMLVIKNDVQDNG